MKRICDYPDNTNFEGFRYRGLKTGKIYTVLPQLQEVGILRDCYWHSVEEETSEPSRGGWYWNDCEVEVVGEGDVYLENQRRRKV